MSSGRTSGEVGQPAWLPDFVDLRDLGELSLEASSRWGEDVPRGSDSGTTRAPERSSWEGGAAPSDQVKSVGARLGSSDKRGSRGRTGKKKQLTWAQKQQRKEARAQKRQDEEAAARSKDPLGFAREIVLTQLTAAPKSRAQLVEKLRAKEVDEETIEAVLDRMEDVGLVDDAAYAGMLVRSQVATRGLARRALAQELHRKGIEGPIAAQALEQVDDDSERLRAHEIARKKLATMTRLDEQTQTRRLAGLLARKGYPPSIVWSVIKEVQGSFDPDEAL